MKLARITQARMENVRHTIQAILKYIYIIKTLFRSITLIYHIGRKQKHSVYIRFFPNTYQSLSCNLCSAKAHSRAAKH